MISAVSHELLGMYVAISYIVQIGRSIGYFWLLGRGSTLKVLPTFLLAITITIGAVQFINGNQEIIIRYL